MKGQSLIATVTGELIPVHLWLQPDGRVTFKADADIDVDGSGPSHGDPYYQPDTSLHLLGQPLNSDVDRYIVVPPAIIRFVKPVVLGCMAKVTYRGKTTDAVVGDVGPRTKAGEISRACAIALGINPSPISGGVDSIEVDYEIFPGTPAPGYALQPS
jgi:hypothetical protein